MKQNLIFQDRENPEGVVYSPELLDDNQNWAYLRAAQTLPDYEEGEEEHEQLRALINGQTSGMGLKHQLRQKQKKNRGSADSTTVLSGDQASGGAAPDDSEIFDRLQGILDSNDPRFERLYKQNMRHLERGVSALSDNMGLAIDQYYANTIEAYRDTRNQTNFDRETLIPQVNESETTEEMISIAKAPWQYGNLPGVQSRAPKLIQEPQLLEKLHAKLKSMKPMELWNEPVEAMPQSSESFCHSIHELLNTISARPLDKLPLNDRNDLVTLQANAIQSVFGLAVLSGSFEMISSALSTIQDFADKTSEENVQAVFTQCKPALVSYLEQIKEIVSQQRGYHTLHGDNISAVFGSQIKVYPNSSFNRNNTSITTDGAYLYLLMGQEKRGNMYKIGTGMNGTLAGRVYLETRSKKEGNLTWAHCRGKLYMRRSGEEMGSVAVIDPNDFRTVGELNLDLKDQFQDNKELLRRNKNYPLLSDGDFLYTIVMTVEKRIRSVKSEHLQKAKALQQLKLDEREKQNKEKREKKAEEEKKKKEDDEKNRKQAADKLDDSVSKLLFYRRATQKIDEIDFFHGQEYYTAVFKVLKFDLDQTKETRPKIEANSEEIDFLSLSEETLFSMPLVKEMYTTFSGFYNLKRCALALQHNNDDIHDAGQWLIEEKDAPYFRQYAQKTASLIQQTKKEQPVKTLKVVSEHLLGESVLTTKWDPSASDNPTIKVTAAILLPECLECGKWTINSNQITYHTDYRSSVANFVFSLDEKDITKKVIPSKEQVALEKSSFENSRQQPTEKVAVPSYIQNRRRGPPEEELSNDMSERIKEKFQLHDPEKAEKIGMEFFEVIIRELDLVKEDEDEAIENAFYGLDNDERVEMRHDEFLVIARRLTFKKKHDEDKKKMAEISEEQIEAVFERHKNFNHSSEEECLSIGTCYDALRKLNIKMNPREYERRFFEFDENRDRHINFEEFRRFLGKDPKESVVEKEKSLSVNNKKKVHVSNLVFFWDQVEWRFFTSHEVSEGMHTASKESKRSEIAKISPEDAQAYDWISEWNLYEEISTRNSNILVEADLGKQLENGACYFTYDKLIGKFVCMSLTHSNNFFLVEAQTQTIPQTFAESPSTEIQEMASLSETVLNLLAWVNEHRFKMPWRWVLWSQTFKNVLQFMEKGKNFLNDMYLNEEEEKKKTADANFDDATKNAIKRIKKRLQIFEGREVTRELYRLDQPIANSEQANAYREKKIQKERSKNAAKGSTKVEEIKNVLVEELDSFVLPLEKIYLAQENRKLYAYCITGNERVVKQVFDFLKTKPLSEVYYRALLDCFTYADQLLAYHNPTLMNQIRKFLLAQVNDTTKTTETVRQYIWRILVVGWYKFAPTSSLQLSLISLFVAKSAQLPLASAFLPTATSSRWLDRLLSLQQPMTPIELFNHRFFSLPASFFFLEMVQLSKVGRYHVCLKTEELHDPQYVGNNATGEKFLLDCQVHASKIQEQDPSYKDILGSIFFEYVSQLVGKTATPKVTSAIIEQPIRDIKRIMADYNLFKTTVQLTVEQLERDGEYMPSKSKLKPANTTADTSLNVVPQKKETSVILSNTVIVDVDEKKSISFRNRSKISLLSNYKKLLDCPQVNQSLTNVPIEFVVLHNLKTSDDPQIPVTECYFSMPLYHVLNDEMINFDSPDLPSNDLKFLCERYSDDAIFDADLTQQEKKGAWFKHLVNLREVNEVERYSLINAIMKAIEKSMVSGEGDYSWDDQSSTAMINVLKRLLQSAYSILKVHNPIHLKGTIEMLSLIDQAFTKLSIATDGFNHALLTETNFKWLDQMKGLVLTVLQNMECNLGYVMQTEMAVQTLPMLMSVFQTVKKLFTRHYTVTDEETGAQSDKVVDLLNSLSTLNIEGTDPASYRVFESLHPVPAGNYQHKDKYQVPRAIGYMIEFDPQSKKCSDGNIHIGTSRTTHEIHQRDIGTVRNLVLVGSSLTIKFTSSGNQKNWGVKLTVKPIIGKPQLQKNLSADSATKKVYMELEALLQSNHTRYMSGGLTQVTSWLNLLNQLVFLISYLTRGLQDTDLISQQTNGRLSNGVGIFRNFGKSSQVLASEIESDQALNYALTKYQEPKQKKFKETNKSATESEIEKQKVLEWQLLKSGLFLPGLQDKSNFECIIEGLRLVSDSLIRRQEEKLHSLKLQNEEKKDGKVEAKSSQLDRSKKQLSEYLLRRQSSHGKLDEVSDDFKGRSEVWSAELQNLLQEPADGSESLIAKILKKIRKDIGQEQLGYTNIWRRPTAKPYKANWDKVQQLFVAAVMYHSSMLGTDCEAFLALDSNKCFEIASVFKTSPPESTVSLSSEEIIVYQFNLIRTKVDHLLTWMQNRLEAQSFFNFAIEGTIEIAKDLIQKAVNVHRQDEETRLMTEAEQETITYNRKVKELEEIEKANIVDKNKADQEEKKKKEAEDKKRKQSAGKVRSSAPAGMRRNQRSNVQRLARPMLKAQPQPKKNQQPSTESDQYSSLVSSFVLNNSKNDTSLEENKHSQEEKDKLSDLAHSSQQKEEPKFLDLTDSELVDLKKAIYEKAQEKFEQDYSGKDEDIQKLCIFFDLEMDEKRSKTLRTIFKNIKSRIFNFIDFDNELMPIPATFNDKIIKNKNPLEEVAKDVINRLNFLFEVKPSTDYRAQVTKQLKVIHKTNENSGFDEITFEEDDQAQEILASDQPSKQILLSSTSESLSDLLRSNTSPIQAVFAFAKCSKISDLVQLRNLMLDQLYLANYRLYSMQVLIQLYNKIAPTTFARFVQGSVSYSLCESTIHQIETCGEKTTRLLNAVSCQLVKSIMHQLINLQEKLARNEQEQRAFEKEQAEIFEKMMTAQLIARPSEKQPALVHQLQQRPLFMTSRNSQEQKMPMEDRRPEALSAREHAFAKHIAKKASFENSKLVEDQRQMLQGLNDIRVLLSNEYSQEYFLRSLKRTNDESVSDLTIETVTKFLQVIIKLIVGAQTVIEVESQGTNPVQSKLASSARPSSPKVPSTVTQGGSTVLNLSIQLANAGRTILDSLLINNYNQNSIQQLLTDIALELVVEQLEKVCYEEQIVEGNSVLFVKIDDCKHKEEYIQLLKLFSELTRGSDARQNSQAGELQQRKVLRSAQLLANMVLHAKVPEVMRIAVKCAKIYLRKVDLRDIKLLRTSVQTDDPKDFLSEAFRAIGEKLSNTEPTRSVAVTETENNGPKDEAKTKQDLDTFLQESYPEPVEKPSALDSGKEYYVYANLNTPLEEDFTFVVTTLWHWYQCNPHPNLKLVTDPAEITVEPPSEEVKKEIENKATCKNGHLLQLAHGKPQEYRGNVFCNICKKLFHKDQLDAGFLRCGPCRFDVCPSCIPNLSLPPPQKMVKQKAQKKQDAKKNTDELKKREEDNNFEDMSQLFGGEEVIAQIPDNSIEGKNADEAPVIQDPVEEEKKAEAVPAAEEEKGEPDAEEEEKKQEVSAEEIALALKAEEEAKENERVAAEEAKEKERIAAEQLIEKERKEKEEAEKKEKELAEKKEKELTEREASAKILSFIKEECPDFEINENWMNLLSSVKSERQAPFGVNKAVEALAKSGFAPSLAEILQHARGGNNFGGFEIIKDSEDLPKKISDLKEILKLIITETYKDPYKNDTEEVKQQKMKEKNFNTLLMAVMEEAVKIATAMTQRRSVAIAGPLPFVKAHQLTQLINRAYSQGLTSVPLNPFMKPEMAEKKVKFVESEICAQDIMPITEDKVRKHCGKKPPKAFFTRLTITIAPKELKVTICDKETACELEMELLIRGENKTLFKQPKQDKRDRISGSIRMIPMSQPEPMTVFKEFVQPMGSSKQTVIQELIQLVRSLIEEQSKPALAHSKTLRKQRTINKKEIADKQLVNGSVQSLLIVKVNSILKELAQTPSWKKGFSLESKQVILGLVSIIGGWQPCFATGQLIQIDKEGSGTSKENKAIIIDKGFAKGKISVIPIDADDVKIVKVDTESAQAIYSHNIDLKGTFGRNIDTESLFSAIMNLNKQVVSSIASSFVENVNSKENLTSPEFLLLMLLKLTTMLPSVGENADKSLIDFIQILIQINQRGQDNSEHEGKSSSFWEMDLAKQWVNLIDNSQELNTNFYLPREQYQSSEQADKESDIQVVADLGMQDLMKRASTQIQETQFVDLDYVQPKNYYLMGLPEHKVGVNDQEMAKIRRLKFYVDNVIPRAADAVSVDAYSGGNQRLIQYAMESIIYLMKTDQWKSAMDELRNTVKGSEINFPDKNWDWNMLFFDEISVDSWTTAKLKLVRSKGEDDEDGTEEKLISDDSKKDIKKLGIPLLDKLLDLGIEEILVQVKAMEYKRNCVLAEYTDSDTMTKYWLWLPMSSLRLIPALIEPAAISFLPQTLNKKFKATLKNTVVAYARQSLLKIVHELQSNTNAALSMFKMPVDNLKLHDIISWGVWEKFGRSPVVGWMEDFRYVFFPQKINDKKVKIDTTQKASEEQQLNEDQAVSKIKQIFDECADQFTRIQLQTDSDIAKNDTSDDKQSETLIQVKQGFNDLVQGIESEGEEAQTNERKMFQTLVEQCVTNWGVLAKQIASEKAVIDICRELENLKKMKTSGQNTLPLHELLPCHGRNAISTLLMFKRGGVKITPGTKVNLYSDPDQINRVHQIVFHKGVNYHEMEPVRIPEGKIWVQIEQSMELDLLQPEEIVNSPRLECAVFQIPKEWTVVCWLTETITLSLVKDGAAKSIKFAMNIFEHFMQAIVSFYNEANAPGLLKSITLKLISRLVIKTRFLYSQLEQAQAMTAEFADKPHLEKLFIPSSFINNLMSEADKHLKNEDESLQNQSKTKILYPAFVQDAAEVLMSIAVPLTKSAKIQMSTELLMQGQSEQELPKWTNPLINVSHFVHFFRGETRLPQKLIEEVFQKSTKKHFKHHLDNVLVIRKVPSTHQRYTRTWIMQKIIQILKMHQARIIDPYKDISVMPDEEDPQNFHSIVIYIDDFSHLRHNDKEEKVEDDDQNLKIVHLYSQTDDEGEGDEAAVDDKPKEDEQHVSRPSMYNCLNVGVCGGFENDIDNENCCICDAPRPPMEELMASLKLELKKKAAEEKAAAALNANSDDEEGEPLHHIRLKMLRRDIRHIISHDQRLIALQKLEESKKDKEEEEKRKKIEAEQSNKEINKPENAKEGLSPLQEEEEKKAQEKREKDSDDSPEDQEPVIDLQNLPEDRNERLRLLGVDQALIEESDEQLLEMIEQGTIDELRKKNEKLKTAQDERRQRRKAKDDARKAKELKNSGQGTSMIKLEVFVMQESTFGGPPSVKLTLEKALQARAQKSISEDGDFQLSEAAKQAITKLHKLFQSVEIGKLSIPADIEDKLADFGIRKETLKSNSTEDVLAKMKTILMVDSAVFFKLLVSQGFDFWFSQACFPVCELNKIGVRISDLMKSDLLSRVRQLVETDFCKNHPKACELDPALLRMMHKIEGRTERKDFSAILDKGDTTDEEQAAEDKKAAEAEEEKKGEPDEVEKQEEKKELAQEEDKKTPEKAKEELEARQKRKADKEAKVKSVREALQKMKTATIYDVWQQDSFNQRQSKSLMDDQKEKIKKAQSTLDKPKKSKILRAWKAWANKHANDRKLTWEQTLQSTDPISCFNDLSVSDVYAEVFNVFDQAQLRFVWTFIRVFNKYFTKAIRFINQANTPVSAPKTSQPMCISAYLNCMKDICLSKAKTDLSQLVLERTAIAADEDQKSLPKIVFSRLKNASEETGDDKVKASKAKPSFLQAYEQFKNMEISRFRQPRPQGNLPHLAFKAVFKGEDVQGDGGPYRQVFQDWSAQLQPEKKEGAASIECLDLLQPCANKLSGEQIGRDRFVLHTERNSSSDLQKFYFLGVLMGICCRTGVIFTLDLPKMFWKQITGQRITLDDLVEVEFRFLRSMQQMLTWTKDVFEMMPQYWKTTLPDGRELDLTEDGDGDTRQVEFEDRFEFIRQALIARLTKTQEQMQAVRRGLCQIVPESMLNIGNQDDLETWVCGSSLPDIDLLRRHTEYPKDNPDYSKDSPLIKNFWKMLEELSQEDKKKFIIFCWGQQRLPPNDAAFESAHVVFKIKAQATRDKRDREVKMDDQLPHASTCFFHLTLPKYSSYEIMMKKVLIGVHNDCVSMNAEVAELHNQGNRDDDEE